MMNKTLLILVSSLVGISLIACDSSSSKPDPEQLDRQITNVANQISSLRNNIEICLLEGKTVGLNKLDNSTYGNTCDQLGANNELAQFSFKATTDNGYLLSATFTSAAIEGLQGKYISLQRDKNTRWSCTHDLVLGAEFLTNCQAEQ